MTLLELLVTLALMGIIAGVATMAFRRFHSPDPGDPRVMLADSLRRSVAEGRTITIRALLDSGAVQATAYPDGSVVADSALAISRLTGIPFDARP